MFVAHRLRASSFICSFSFRFHTPDHIRCYGECMTSCSPTSVTVSAVLITMMHYLLRSLGFSRCPQHGLAISAQLLLLLRVLHHRGWSSYVLSKRQNTVPGSGTPVDDSCTCSILTTSRTWTVVWVKNIVVFASPWNWCLSESNPSCLCMSLETSFIQFTACWVNSLCIQHAE